MTEAAKPPDWSKIPEDVARLIFEQGEKHLSGQLAAGLGSDQRAMTAAAIFIGFASAIVAAGIAASADRSVLIAALVGGAIMLIGGAMCAFAARPVRFHLPGNHPSQWWGVATEPITELIGGETENYQDMILDNEKVLTDNKKWLEWGVLLSSLAPIIGVGLWFLVTYLSSGSPAASPAS